MAVHILSVGRDSTLLAIRSLILSHAGYGVVAVASEKEFVAKLVNGDSFAAVVLCHTLPEEQRKRLVGLIQTHRPATPLVVLSGAGDSSALRGDRARVFGDTRDLLRELPQLLRSSEQRGAM